VILGSPVNPGARIGLVSFADPPAPSSRQPRRKVGEGDMVFVFDVADARRAHERLQSAGADIVETPQVYLSKQLDARGRPMEGRVFHVFDPDGNLIELLEAPKAAAS
jgi:predicted enzyme related to lactoylglutathione lyase